MHSGKNKSGPKICVLGSGFVGQATGKGLISKGFDVSFLDVVPEKIEKLTNDGYQTYLLDELKNGLFSFDISFISVPTPTENNKFNEKYVREASQFLGEKIKYLNKYHLVVVKSTVLPGTTENVVIKTIEEKSGKKAGRDFGVCVNPEYLRERSALDDFINAWVVVIGAYDERSAETLYKVYRDFNCPKYILTIKEAEIQKYVHNIFNAIKITFFNEMRALARRMGIETENVYEITAQSSEGMWNPRYGIKEKGPFSGNCLPKDSQAFLSWAKEQGISADLLRTAIDVNHKIEKAYEEKERLKNYGAHFSA